MLNKLLLFSILVQLRDKLFMLFISFIDRRESRCYLNAETLPGRGPRCSKETGGPMTKATCCCSLGKAWGITCEICPLPDSKEYKDLCPGGTGYSPNVITVIKTY